MLNVSRTGALRPGSGPAALLLASLSLLVASGRTAARERGRGDPSPAPVALGTFTNPIIRSQATADPWLVYRDGHYYFTFTAGKSIEVWKSATLTGLERARKVTVWRAPERGPNAEHVWAPEIHFLNGRWYIYYTATDGPDANRRQFVLEATTPDAQGPYLEKARLVPPAEDEYAIDGTVYQAPGGGLYYLWSGREKSEGGPQNLYIAPMSNPWTLSGPRVLLSTPTYPWERVGWWVNEGPQVLRRGGKTFIIYSASGGSTPDYSLGLLTNSDGNLLRAESWSKSPVPVFSKYPGTEGLPPVYTPGHNGFCKSPDGREDWIVYHARDKAERTWAGRMARAQRFTWAEDGSPYFGYPVSPGIPLAVPSGEPGSRRLPGGRGRGLRAEYFAGRDLTARPRLTRVDRSPNFDWGLSPPAPGIDADGFSVRWRGQIVPRFSEEYTLTTYADDGVRVWLDGRMLIDNWTERKSDEAGIPVPSADQFRVRLTAGRRHALRIEYYDATGPARMSLAWLSERQPFEPVPSSRLYPLTPSSSSSRGSDRGRGGCWRTRHDA